MSFYIVFDIYYFAFCAKSTGKNVTLSPGSTPFRCSVYSLADRCPSEAYHTHQLSAANKLPADKQLITISMQTRAELTSNIEFWSILLVSFIRSWILYHSSTIIPVSSFLVFSASSCAFDRVFTFSKSSHLILSIMEEMATYLFSK